MMNIHVNDQIPRNSTVFFPLFLKSCWFFHDNSSQINRQRRKGCHAAVSVWLDNELGKETGETAWSILLSLCLSRDSTSLSSLYNEQRNSRSGELIPEASESASDVQLRMSRPIETNSASKQSVDSWKREKDKRPLKMASNLTIQDVRTVSLERPSMSGSERTLRSTLSRNTSRKSCDDRPPAETAFRTRSERRKSSV